MRLAKVEGSVMSSVKNDSLRARTLLIVRAVNPDGSEGSSEPYVAVDDVGAGEGEVVLVVHGTPAMRAVSTSDVAIDAVIVGIVDSTTSGGQITFRKD